MNHNDNVPIMRHIFCIMNDDILLSYTTNLTIIDISMCMICAYIKQKEDQLVLLRHKMGAMCILPAPVESRESGGKP